MYVLLTNFNTYFVEYLLGYMALSKSIEDAMIFDDLDTAIKFKQMLYRVSKLETSVNTFIK